MTLNRLQDSGELLSAPEGVPLVQRTTLAVDALARYVCNTWEEVLDAQGSAPFDVVIVGSGMYGGYCAAKLFEFGFELGRPPRVLVLESGPFLITQHVQNLPRLGSLDATVQRHLLDPQQVTPAGVGFVPHHRCVGGKSLFWGGWTPRLTDDDFAKAWPQEVVAYLKTPRPAAGPAKDGYGAVEQENGTWPVADFINGALFEILRARASEVLHPPAANLVTLRAVPNFPADANAKWLTFKTNAPPAIWSGLTESQKQAQFAALENVGEQLDAKPDFSPLNPTIGVLGSSPGSGLFASNKFSSLPLLIDAIRDDAEIAKVDAQRRLFLVPNAEVLKLEVSEEVVREVVAALRDPQDPDNRSAARVVRLRLAPGGLVVLAGNTINSTRLALNSFPRPAELEPKAELMGRNLMAHVRGNFFWRVDREKLSVPPDLPSELQTAALHVRGVVATSAGPGQFHFQFYATPNLDARATSPEQFLYRMVPNLEDFQTILDSQRAGKIVVGIRCTGETFGDKSSVIGSRFDVGWMSVNPFGGFGDDVYRENGQELRVPKAFVNLVETSADTEVRQAQTQAAFQFVAALANVSKPDAENSSDGAPVQFLAGSSQEDAVGTTYHESGTLWMGDDYVSSVTDSQGRFHHVGNAYVTDQSLFPSVGSANPVNTGLTLTRKLARGIIERFKSSPVGPLEPGFQALLRTQDFAAEGWQYAGPLFGGKVPFFDVWDSVPVIGAGLNDASFDSVLGVLWFRPQTFADFILRLDFRTFDERANGGVFIRAPEPTILDAPNFYNSATEIQIDERGFHFDPPRSFYGHPLNRTGAVYGVFPARQVAHRVVGPRGSARAGLWSAMEIRAQGTDIQVRINGLLVSSGTLRSLQPAGAANAPNQDPAFKRADGIIGLQCHTEVVQYRSIRIRPLP